MNMKFSHFNEDSKHIISSREALISGVGRPENLRKWQKIGKSIVMKIIKLFAENIRSQF